MEIIKGRVDWYEGYGNRPVLKLLVDKMPTQELLRHQLIDCGDGCTFVFAELGGYVDFFFHNPRDQRGYGSRTFTVTTVDGEKKEFKGPWSSGSSSTAELNLCNTMDVSITDDPLAFKRGHTFYAGHVTVNLVKKFINRIEFPKTYTIRPGSGGGVENFGKMIELNGVLEIVNVEMHWGRKYFEPAVIIDTTGEVWVKPDIGVKVI